MTEGSAESEMEELLGEVDLSAVQSALIDWYEDDHRSFPWRETSDPYKILVSEVMSQQTQLSRVEPAWRDFLESFPSVQALAEAEREEVIRFWTEHNLGYNNRARYLHEAARQIVQNWEGQVPQEPEELEELMGVGPYTANAVASFAFNNGDAVVDTNVRRVLYRAFDVKDADDRFERVARWLMPEDSSRTWNNAIMELGGVVCGKQPRCDSGECPWREWCHAYASGDFTAPDVPEPPAFEGSRRQFRGRIIEALSEHGTLGVDDLGPYVRVDYSPEGDHGRAWLRDLLDDLEDDGLVDTHREGPETEVSLSQ